MKRRTFIQSIAAAAAILSIPASMAASGGGSLANPEDMTPKAFSKIAVVECTVIDMMRGKQRKIAIDSTRPEVITEGRGGRFAISVAEHSDKYLALTFLTPVGSGYKRGQTTYVGKEGLQVLKDKGLVLQFVTHE